MINYRFIFQFTFWSYHYRKGEFTNWLHLKYDTQISEVGVDGTSLQALTRGSCSEDEEAVE
jgi:hypothetical protein